MRPAEILRALYKYGLLAPVLAWALWENSKNTERLIKVIETNSTVLQRFNDNECREASQ